jgi:NTP pyrophosphatase (non-canonical NTP hydrolase)
MLLNELIEKTIQWAKDRKIIQNSTPEIQGLKLMSEMGELADNLAKKRDCRDDIGDCMVVLINIAEMKGYTIEECLTIAYNDIKDRKGYVNENGLFIKNGDVEPI